MRASRRRSFSRSACSSRSRVISLRRGRNVSSRSAGRPTACSVAGLSVNPDSARASLTGSTATIPPSCRTRYARGCSAPRSGGRDGTTADSTARLTASSPGRVN